MSELTGIAVVEGIPFDREAWWKVAHEARNISYTLRHIAERTGEMTPKQMQNDFLFAFIYLMDCIEHADAINTAAGVD